MKITFHGAARSVTGSQFLLEINGRSLLLDCGLFQGSRKEAFETNRNFAFDPRELDAVILSHAHIDHCGNLPNLVRNGFQGPIYTTHVSAHLIELLLADSAHIQEYDAQYLNMKNQGKGLPRVEPLYTQEDAAQVHQYVQKMDYQKSFEVLPGVTARLVEAGHILGSAGVALDIRETNGTRKPRRFCFWFSGDIGRLDLPIVRDPVLPEGADYLLMESTYGDTPHIDTEEAYIQLRDVVQRTLKRGGKVIIPAFAVGRTQELVYSFHRMMEEQGIPRVPVFVDSTLAVDVSDVFRSHPQFFDQEMLDMMDDGHDTLGFKKLTYVQSVEESKKINERKEPMIIISSSGMAESGRILHHLRHNLGDPASTVLIVSYQAPNTLGRRLADGQKSVKIFGDLYPVVAEVVRVRGFSAHAGQDFLMEYALASKDTLKAVYLVHGEQDAAEALQGSLKASGIKKVMYPYPKQVVEI